MRSFISGLHIYLFILISYGKVYAVELCSIILSNIRLEPETEWLKDKIIRNKDEQPKVLFNENNVAGLHAGPLAALEILIRTGKIPTNGEHQG